MRSESLEVYTGGLRNARGGPLEFQDLILTRNSIFSRTKTVLEEGGWQDTHRDRQPGPGDLGMRLDPAASWRLKRPRGGERVFNSLGGFEVLPG